MRTLLVLPSEAVPLAERDVFRSVSRNRSLIPGSKPLCPMRGVVTRRKKFRSYECAVGLFSTAWRGAEPEVQRSPGGRFEPFPRPPDRPDPNRVDGRLDAGGS
jgi:hypothetical protein